ncbi:MAG: Major fimbrium subunit FimA type-4 [Petrimonas sp.]|uniref:fimbrial protein n=1 Tax=Petrimonas sp. TaxID=2023866 RepID=UPI0030D318F0
MKIGKLFLAGVITLGLGLTACNNDTPEVQQEKGGILTVSVTPISEPGAGTRIAGNINDAALATAESAVNGYEVWVFNTNGNLEKYHQQADANSAQILGLTVGAKEVVVVANGNLGTQPTKAALLAKTNTLSQNIDGGMLMTAEPAQITLTECKADHSDCNTLAAEVKRVNARVAVVGVSTSFAAEAPYKRFELAEVAMFNVRQTSNIFGASLLNATSKFLFGSAYPSPENSYVAAPEGIKDATLLEILDPVLNVKGTPLDAANSKYFYVHENDSTAKKETFVVLKGKLYDAAEGGNVYLLPGVHTDSDGFTYYKVYVNKTMDGYTYTGDEVAHDGTVIRNTQYNITIDLTKAGNPTIDEPAEACLKVTVSVVPWVVVNQNVSW